MATTSPTGRLEYLYECRYDPLQRNRPHRSIIGSCFTPLVFGIGVSAFFVVGLTRRNDIWSRMFARQTPPLQSLPRLDSPDRFNTSSDLGTAYNQWTSDKYEYRGEDICLDNVIRDNEIITNVRRYGRVYILHKGSRLSQIVCSAAHRTGTQTCISRRDFPPDTCVASLIYRVTSGNYIRQFITLTTVFDGLRGCCILHTGRCLLHTILAYRMPSKRRGPGIPHQGRRPRLPGVIRGHLLQIAMPQRERRYTITVPYHLAV